MYSQYRLQGLCLPCRAPLSDAGVSKQNRHLLAAGLHPLSHSAMGVPRSNPRSAPILKLAVAIAEPLWPGLQAELASKVMLEVGCGQVNT